MFVDVVLTVNNHDIDSGIIFKFGDPYQNSFAKLKSEWHSGVSNHLLSLSERYSEWTSLFQLSLAETLPLC